MILQAMHLGHYVSHHFSFLAECRRSTRFSSSPFLFQRFFTTFSRLPRHFRRGYIFAVIRFALTKWSTEWPRIYSSFRRSAVPAQLFQPFCKRARVKKSTKARGGGKRKGKWKRNGEEEEEEGNNIAVLFKYPIFNRQILQQRLNAFVTFY